MCMRETLLLQQSPDAVGRRAAEIGPATTAVVEALLAEATLTRLREVQARLRLVDR